MSPRRGGEARGRGTMATRRCVSLRPLPRAARLTRVLTRRPWLSAPLVVVALALGVPQTYGAFSGLTNGSGSWATAASFPTYPQSVTGDAAQFQHRSDDAASYDDPATAADSSGNNRPGSYSGPTDGPSTWYKFDDGSGTAAADSSGAANPGTLTNSPAWSAGHTGTGGLSFDGVDDLVTGEGRAVDTGNSFTVAAWVTVTDTVSHRTILSQDGTNVSAFFLQFKLGENRWAFRVRDSDSTSAAVAQVLAPSAPALNRWTHLAGVYDDAADEIRLYIDGALIGTAAKTADWSSTGPLIAGAARWGAGTRVDHHKGQIDDVRTYRRALTGTEIAQVHGSPSTWWTFDSTNSSQTDESGNGNTGAVHGTPAYSGAYVTMDGNDHATGARPGMHTDRSFSVAAYAYPTSTTGVLTVASQPGTTASAFHLGSNAGAWRFTVTGSDAAAPTAAVATATTAATANTLAHLVAVYSDEADEVRIYVNGKLEDTSPATADWDATGVLNAGRMLSGGTYSGFFVGRVHDLKVFGHALHNDDVHDLYHAPAARYDFEEDNATTAVDGTGNGRTATRPSGTTTWVPSSHRGGGMTFSSSGYLATARPVLDTSTSYSVSAWAYVTATSTGNRTVVSQDGNNTSAFFLQYNNSYGTSNWAFSTRPADGTSGGVEVLSPNGSAALNRWTHVVGVYDDGADAIRLYVNGASAGSATMTADFNAPGPLTIGAAKYGGSRTDFWAGQIDGVAVYPKVLSAADVAVLYGQAPSLRWDVNENTGTTLGDRSGSNNNGTVANGPVWTTGTQGGALSFDGVDDQVTSSVSPMRTDTSFTVSAWVYLADTTTTRMAVSQNGTSYYGYGLGYAGGKWAFVVTTSDVGGSSSAVAALSGVTPTTNTWVHLTGVYDDAADRLHVYVNGTLEGTNTHTTDWHAPGSLVLGWARNGGAVTHRWVGRVDEVHAYDRVLRHTEVQALHGFYALQPAPTQIHLPTMSAGLPGALQGAQQGEQSSTAVGFNGTGNGYNPIQYANPTTFSLEAWFRASGTAGGSMVSFGSAPSGTDVLSRDRHVYLDSGGRVTFGVFPGSVRSVRSSDTYNDGQWHHVVATLGPAGMYLYVDGAQVGADPAVTTADNFAGYWRWGGISLFGWPNRPSRDYFIGTLDEVAVYPTQLTANQVARHYAANH